MTYAPGDYARIVNRAAKALRPKKLQQLVTAQALSLSAKSTREYLFYSAEEHVLRTELEPLTGDEQFHIAQRVTARLAQYAEDEAQP